MSARLFARALPSSSSVAIPRPSTSAIRSRLPPRSVLGASVRWNSAVAEKARAAKFLPDFSLAGKVCIQTLVVHALALISYTRSAWSPVVQGVSAKNSAGHSFSRDAQH